MPFGFKTVGEWKGVLGSLGFTVTRTLLSYAVERLRNKLEYTTVGFQLLPRRFTLTELQQVYEAILGRSLDKRNFRRKLALLGILKPSKERRQERGRPAQLFEFSARDC